LQAAINAARADLPASLRQNPSYYKVNPINAPIAILAMTSDTLTRGQIYDAALRVMQQGCRRSRESAGSISAAARCRRCGSSSTRWRSSNTASGSKTSAPHSPPPMSPKGAIEDGDCRRQIYTNDKANHAEDYRPLVIADRDGAPVRLSDVAAVEDSVENLHAIGLANGKPAVVARFAASREPISLPRWSASRPSCRSSQPRPREPSMSS
jgi:multidrug efflux pump